MKKNKLCGIYCIENTINEKKYIGQSANINARINQHKRDLNNNKNTTPALQKAWNKYKETNFIFYILIECILDKKLLDKLEIFFIKEKHSHVSEWGYNISKGGNTPTKDLKLSQETKNKISLSKKGKKRNPFSEEWKNNISESNKGKNHTDEYKLKMSERTKGENNPFYNKKHSQETKEKMSEFRKGKKHKKTRVYTEEEKEERHFLQQGKSPNKKTSSKYVGVFWNKNIKKWTAVIKYRKKCYYLGNYLNENEAAEAYNAKALELYGQNAKLNIIEKQ